MTGIDYENQVLDELQRVVTSAEFRDARLFKLLLTQVVFEHLANWRHPSRQHAVVGHDQDAIDRSSSAWSAIEDSAAQRLRCRLDNYYRTDGRFNLLRLEMLPGRLAIAVKDRTGRDASPGRGRDTAHPVLGIDAFDCTSGVPEHQEFSADLLGEIYLALASTECVILPPPGNLFESEQALPKHSRLPGANELQLACTLRWSGNRLRLFCQLIEASSCQILWMELREFDWMGGARAVRELAVDFVVQGVSRSCAALESGDLCGATDCAGTH